MNRLNIIHIIVDQMGTFGLSCSGNPYVKTPHFDYLAGKSIRFDLAYSSQAVCTANRSSMLLGMQPSKIGDHYETWPTSNRVWTKEELKTQSIGWNMRRAGYEAAYVGKWHVNYCNKTTQTIGYPEDNGFEWLGEKDDYYDGASFKVTPPAISFLKKKHNQPFFLTASYIQPHGTCFWGGLSGMNSTDWPEGADPWDSQFQGDGSGFPNPLEKYTEEEFFNNQAPPIPENYQTLEIEPEWLLNQRLRESRFPFQGRGKKTKHWTIEQIWRAYQWNYYRLCEQADREVGELLDYLEQFGFMENTVIIFSSDHGDGMARHANRNKDNHYDEDARIPLLVYYPETPNAGTVDTTHLVSCGIDLLPTVCDLAGAKIPDTCRGISLKPLLEGRQIEWRAFLVMESPMGRSLRTAEWKYNFYLESPEHPEQFFNMIKDPGETKDLAGDTTYIKEFQRHKCLLKGYLKKEQDPFPISI